MEVNPIKCFLLDHGYSTLTSAPCCDVKEIVPRVTSFSELHSDRRYLEIKQSMDQGVWHKACEYCRVVEQRGDDNIKSKRQLLLHKFNNDIEKDTLVELQLAPGYLCNIQCRICTPYLSSSWIKEYRNMPLGILHEKNPFPVEYIQVSPAPVYDYANDDWSNLKQVDFVGGEPIYNNEFYVQLKKLFDKTGGNCCVNFATNGTVTIDFKKYPWISEFNDMHINFSIDSVGPSAEFIRTGTSWNKVEQNIKLYQSLPQFNISYHLTNSVLNILETANTINYLKLLNVRRSSLTIHVTEPYHLSYSVLTDNEKTKIAQLLQGTSAEYIISALNDSVYTPEHRSKFLLFMEHTKNYHGMDWKDYVPALYKIMNQQNK